MQYLLVGKIRWEKRAGGQSRVRVSPELVQVTPGSRRRPRGSSRSTPRSPTCSRCRPTSRAGWPRRSTSRWATARGSRSRGAADPEPRGLRRLPEGRWRSTTATSDPARLRQAVSYFEQAVALDTAFAPAWARLSQASTLHQLRRHPEPGAAERARVRRRARAGPGARPAGRPPGAGRLPAPDQAGLRGGPSSSTARASGSPRRMPSCSAASGRPSSVLGRWDASLEHLHQAQRLDPRSVADRPGADARPCSGAERYPTRRGDASERWLARRPRQPARLRIEGDGPGARADLAGAAGDRRGTAGRDPSHPVRGLRRDLLGAVSGCSTTTSSGCCSGSRRRRSTTIAAPGASPSPASLRAPGRSGMARAYADSARIAFEEQIRATPEDAQLHVSTASRSPTRGRKADAIARGRAWRSRCIPISQDAFAGPVLPASARADLHPGGRAGEGAGPARAAAQMPYYLSPAWLGSTRPSIRCGTTRASSKLAEPGHDRSELAALRDGLARPLRARARARPRRHGHGLAGPGPQARPPGRAQGAPSASWPPRSAPSGSSARSGSPPGCSTRTSSPCSTRARPPGRLWFTMPYVEGECLRDRLRRERQLPVDAALRIATRGGAGARVRPPARAWSTATSSRRTSCSPGTARPWWPTSGSRGRWAVTTG